MYTTHVTVPIYAVYIVMAAMVSAIALVAAVFYKSRKPLDLDQLDCEQQAKLFSPQMLAPQLILDTCPRPVQPHSLKNKLSPWKSASQHVIDTLKPECVSEYRGKLNFSVAFEKEISTLHIHLLEAVDLPVKDITAIVFLLVLDQAHGKKSKKEWIEWKAGGQRSAQCWKFCGNEGMKHYVIEHSGAAHT